jgi:hypothetical protein
VTVTWIPSVIPTTIPTTLITHCINVVPSTRIPTAVFTYIPPTIAVPSSVTAEWIPTYIPTTIPATLVQHCVEVVPSTRVPTLAYQTIYLPPTPETYWPTFLPSSVVIPSSYVLKPVTVPQWSPPTTLIAHCANYLPTTVVSPPPAPTLPEWAIDLPTSVPTTLVEKCVDALPAMEPVPVAPLQPVQPVAAEPYYTFASK